MSTISTVVAAHPSREEMVTFLLQDLGQQVGVIWDEKEDIWDTHQRAWEAVDRNATHGLVLQDDAIPCIDFLDGAQRALDYYSDKVVSFYFGNASNHPKIMRAVQRAEEAEASWIFSTGTWWGPAIAIPTDQIDQMLTFCKGRRESYDRRLAIWCGVTERIVYYTWPSLVEHFDAPSLVNPGRRPGRKAMRFLEPPLSAEDWSPEGLAVQCGRINGPVRTTLG